MLMTVNYISTVMTQLHSAEPSGVHTLLCSVIQNVSCSKISVILLIFSVYFADFPCSFENISKISTIDCELI